MPWLQFPVDALPEPIRSYVQRSAQSIGCDPSFVALPLLGCLAAAIGNTRRIRLKPGWEEPCVLWTAIVGDSGTQKTPAITAATQHVQRRQQKALERYEEKIEQFRRDQIAYETALWDWQKQAPDKRGKMPDPPKEPVALRWIVSDVTIEALAERLLEAPRGLLLGRDELAGWIKSFDQYRGGKGGDSAHWLTLYNAKPLLIDRKTANRKVIHVPIASVSIVGGIQPETLRQALGREHWENGLAARLLLVMPPKLPRRWSESSVSESLEAEVDAVFEHLFELTFGVAASGEATHIALPLTPNAKNDWRLFYNRHGGEMAELTGREAALWSKLEGTAPRLALIIHLVRAAARDQTLQTPDAVDETSLAAAIRLADWFGYEGRRIYAVLRETSEDRERRELVELIERNGGSITERELQRSGRRFGTAESCETLLQDLVRRGLGHWQLHPAGQQGGRPSRAFVLASSVDKTMPKAAQRDVLSASAQERKNGEGG